MVLRKKKKMEVIDIPIQIRFSYSDNEKVSLFQTAIGMEKFTDLMYAAYWAVQEMGCIQPIVPKDYRVIGCRPYASRRCSAMLYSLFERNLRDKLPGIDLDKREIPAYIRGCIFLLIRKWDHLKLEERRELLANYVPDELRRPKVGRIPLGNIYWNGKTKRGLI
jgi:hypothetical protein